MQDLLKILLGSLVLSILSAITVGEYFQIFFVKECKKTKPCMWTVYYIWEILIACNMLDYSNWYKIILSLVAVLIASTFFDGVLSAKVVFSVLYVVIWMLGNSLIADIFFIFFDVPLAYHSYIVAFVSRGILLLFVRAIQRFLGNRGVCEFSWKDNGILLFLPIGSMFLIQNIFVAEYKLNLLGWGGIASIFIVLVINVITFYMYDRLSENLELRHKNDIFEKEFELLDMQMKEKERFMLDFRRKRHDLKHQMLELVDLLQNKKYEQLEQRILDLADLTPLHGLKIANTENSIVDAFVNYKYEVAKNKNIKFQVKLDIPTELPFASGDLCIILGNSLDNALEANLRGEVESPFIDLKMKYDGDNLIIVVKNSFDGNILLSKSGWRITRKRDSKNHGMGIKSIQNIIEKYNGCYDTLIKGNEYSLSILLHGT